MDRMLDVTRFAGAHYGNRPSAEAADEAQLRLLADEMEVDPKELIKRSRPLIADRGIEHGRTLFNGLILPTTIIEKRERRFSPAGLKIAPYHRELWDLRLLPACLETGEILTSTCRNPECTGSSLRWRKTLGVDFCEHCVADLKEVRVERLPSDMLTEMRSAAMLFVPNNRKEALKSLPERIKGQDGQIAAELLIRLLTFVDPDLKRFMKKLHLVDAVKVARAVSGAWNIMRDWPHGFEEHALAKLNSRTVKHSDGNARATTSFVNGTNMASASGELAIISKELRDTIDTTGPQRDTIVRATIGLKPATVELGWHTAGLAQIRRNGAMSSRLVLDKLGRLQPQLDRNEVELVSRGIAEHRSIGSVSEMLGISRYGIFQLIDAGRFDLLAHPFFEARYREPQIAGHSFDDFLELLQSKARVIKGKTIPLSSAIKVIGGRLKPWDAIFGALLDGSVKFESRPSKRFLINGVLISIKDLPLIEGFRAENRNPHKLGPNEPLPRIDAGEILNLGSAQSTALFSDKSWKESSGGTALTLANILAIGRSHITTGELALRRNVSTQKAYCDAQKVQIPNHGAAGFDRDRATEWFLDEMTAD
ncbi:MAG: hypothetical protein WA908_02230 [Pontixanthobacter sp.]